MFFAVFLVFLRFLVVISHFFVISRFLGVLSRYAAIISRSAIDFGGFFSPRGREQNVEFPLWGSAL